MDIMSFVEFIEQHNRQGKAFTLGHNQFSDMTLEEYHQHNFLGSYFPGVVRTGETISVNDLLAEKATDKASSSFSRRLGTTKNDTTKPEYPESKNWVKDGAVTEIKNQGHCGSCWAFSTIGAIEGARAVQHKILESLSEQQLVDCDTRRDHGCQGGLMDNAFTYDENSKGLCSLEDYPYVGYKHIFFGCSQYSAECKPRPFTKVVKYEDVEHTEPALKEAISKQPVSVAINAATVSHFTYFFSPFHTCVTFANYETIFLFLLFFLLYRGNSNSIMRESLNLMSVMEELIMVCWLLDMDPLMTTKDTGSLRTVGEVSLSRP